MKYTHVYTGDVATYGVTIEKRSGNYGANTDRIKIVAHLGHTPPTLPLGLVITVPKSRVKKA